MRDIQLRPAAQEAFVERDELRKAFDLHLLVGRLQDDAFHADRWALNPWLDLHYNRVVHFSHHQLIEQSVKSCEASLFEVGLFQKVKSLDCHTIEHSQGTIFGAQMLHYSNENLRVNRLRDFVEGQVAKEVDVSGARVDELYLHDELSLHEVEIFQLELPKEHVVVYVPLCLRLLASLRILAPNHEALLIKKDLLPEVLCPETVLDGAELLTSVEVDDRNCQVEPSRNRL